MPNLTATIGITDNLTSPLRNMANAISSVTQNLNDIATETGKLDPKKFSAMESAAKELDRSVSELETESRKAAEAQEKHNKSMQQGDKESGKLSSGFKSLAGAVAGVVAGYASWEAVNTAVDLSDTLSQTTSRLNMMNDGMQTTEELQQKIYEAAQNSRGSYQDMADMVAKLGTNAKDAFSSNDEMVRFAEQINKQFVLAGAGADEMAAASLQLTQGLASGTLRGDELNSVMEQAPTVIQTIADSLGVTTGQIREMAAEGEITADVVKNAILGAADETDKKFDQMSLTFDQVWTNFKNQALMSFQPVLESINDIANNPELTEGINRVSGVIGGLGPSIASVVSSLSNIIPVGLNAIIDSFQWVIDNGQMVASGLLGIAAAVTAVNVANKVKDAGGLSQMFSGLGNSMSSIIGLINPLNLLIAAIAGVAAAGIYLVATGTSLKEVSDFFTNFQSTVAGAVESITNGIGNIAQGITETFPVFASQLGAMIPTIVEGILGSAMSLIDAGAQIAVALLNGIMTALPSLVTGGISMITNLITGIVSMLPRLAEQAFIIVENFMSALSQNLPNMMQKGAEAILAFVNGVGQSMPAILQAGLSAIVGFAQTVGEHIPTLIQRGIDLVSSLIQGIISMLPSIAATAVSLIMNLGMYIIQNLPQIITAGIEIVGALASGLLQSIPVILSGIGQILMSLITAIGEYGPQILTKSVEIAGQLWEGFKNGLSAGWESFTTFLSDTFNGVVDFVKGIFGIASPSTVFADIGGFLMEGLGNGIQTMWDGISGGISAIGGAIKDLLTPDVDYAQMIENTRNQINQLQSDVQAGYDTIKEITLAKGQEMANGTVAIYGTMTGQILSQIASLASGINSALGNISGSFVNIFNTIRDQTVSYLIQLSGDAVAQINSMISGVAGTLTGLTGIFSQAFIAVTGSVIDQLETMQNNCIAVLKELSGNAVSALQSLSSSAIAVIETMSGGFIGAITTMAESTTTIVATMASTVEIAIGGFHSAVLSEANTFRDSYIGIWELVYSGTVQIMTQLSNDLNSLMSKLVKTLEATGGQLPPAFKQIGSDMMGELASGITSQSQQVIDTTSALVEQIKQIFITGLGIHSPSKFMEWIGQMMAAGLIGGLSSSQINSFVEGIIGDMKNSFKNGNFVPDELVDYLGDDTLKVVEYLTATGDQTLSEAAGEVGVPAIIQEALKYVGYVSPGGNNNSMFGARYGNSGAWCASFVRYCADNVGVTFPPTDYVPSVLEWAEANGRSTQTPVPGYAAIFGGGSHIELVADVLPDGTVVMVGGNTGIGEVKHRPRNDATSYVVLDGGHSTMTLKDTIQQAYNKKMGISVVGQVPGNVSWNENAGVAQWESTVLQALQMVGQPASLLNEVMATLQKESSGNPNAINDWDSNWYAGTPSKGLMQVIDPTFQQYAMPGYDTNIWDPLSNILASLRYQLAVYGDIRARLNGYATGTDSATPGLHWVGENGPELMQFKGGEKVYPNHQSIKIAKETQVNTSYPHSEITAITNNKSFPQSESIRIANNHPQIQSIKNQFSHVTGYATGTTSATKGIHWVGERGPELIQTNAISNAWTKNTNLLGGINPRDPSLPNINLGTTEGSYITNMLTDNSSRFDIRSFDLPSISAGASESSYITNTLMSDNSGFSINPFNPGALDVSVGAPESPLVLNDTNPFDPALFNIDFGASEGSYVNTSDYTPLNGGTTNNFTTEAPINFHMEPTINTREEFELTMSEMQHRMAQALRDVSANYAAGFYK